jgi:hypothetical protein
MTIEMIRDKMLDRLVKGKGSESFAFKTFANKIKNKRR